MVRVAGALRCVIAWAGRTHCLRDGRRRRTIPTGREQANPQNGASGRASDLAARNAARDSSGLAPDEVVEALVAADGVSGVTRVKDHYRDQDGQPNEALVDIDWRLVDGEWYRTLENGRTAEGPPRMTPWPRRP